MFFQYIPIKEKIFRIFYKEIEAGELRINPKRITIEIYMKQNVIFYNTINSPTTKYNYLSNFEVALMTGQDLDILEKKIIKKIEKVHEKCYEKIFKENKMLYSVHFYLMKEILNQYKKYDNDRKIKNEL
ncbi:hypothetical protein A2J07_00495 [Fusobacterium necrophorum subsp. funduliforme]|uniref:Uncharacterized protein n=2 Tax=Fusobacterium necrophorum TaxID=859 RepID=A0A162J6X3_9FUSO|nr:hypothetical protein A2J07_00495 [Fusobacterium necrophorum subsp. funduliforme]